MDDEESTYDQIIRRVFRNNHGAGGENVPFERHEIEHAAEELGVDVPKNLGDVVYAFKYRKELPSFIQEKAPENMNWVLVGRGSAQYAFELRAEARIQPDDMLVVANIPDATPGIVDRYALDDEQALLAKLRYNRMIDTFTGVTCYSIQNHLRTFVPDIGQVETDEIYIGVDKEGAHYVLPVQAKGGRDEIGIIQIEQDLALCRQKFPNLICRAVAAQFMEEEVIALFEFEAEDGSVGKVREKHYRLVSPDELTDAQLRRYRKRTDRGQ